ncbi:MAG: MogA/MoaB family molybdenum cofactor biosynthesis protein [Bacteroidales bacterium]|nr:MogA/MoaB family molybdenum cofactor biosynthesis protein [Bacteroidales bacterium]
MLPDPFHIIIITLSDRASRGEYEDLSGPEIIRRVEKFFKETGLKAQISYHLLPDNRDQLKKQLITHIKQRDDVIFTTGGTGIGPRDFTPDVVRPLLDREIPGVMELIRVKYGMIKPNALISRSVAGVSGQTLLYTLPGSVQAVGEYLDEILPTLIHSKKMILGIDDHH